MEKDQNTETVDTEEEVAIIDSTVNEPTAESNEAVIVKKSGGGLAIFLALLSLGLSSYLFYLNWQQRGLQAQPDNTADLIKQLQDTNAQIEIDNKKFRQQLDALKKSSAQLEQSLAAISDQLSNQTDNQVQSSNFDNTDNEVAIQRLQTQLANQKSQLESLQTQLNAPANIQSMGDLPINNFDAIQNNRVIQSLITAQTLLDTGQISAALLSLENLQQGMPSGFDYRIQLQNIIDDIGQIPQPDLTTLKQRLQAANTAIQALKLPVKQNADETEAKWYDRFISVKKIEANQGVESTFALLSMQSQLNHLLLNAELLLNLQHQSAWQQSLTQAANLLQSQMPQQQNLVQELQQLAAESIKPSVPENVGLMALVNELKGSF